MRDTELTLDTPPEAPKAAEPLSYADLETGGHGRAEDPVRAWAPGRILVAVSRLFTDLSAFVAYPAITIVILIDVVGRNFFLHPLAWATEGSGLFLIMAIFLVGCNVEQTKSHIRIDLLSSSYGPRAQYVLDLFTTAFAGWWTGMMTVRSFAEIPMSITMKESGQDWLYPYWPIRVVMSVAFLVLFLYLAAELLALLLRPLRAREARHA